MKYYTQHGKPGAGQMDPTAWTETEAEGMEAAAVEERKTFLRILLTRYAQLV